MGKTTMKKRLNEEQKKDCNIPNRNVELEASTSSSPPPIPRQTYSNLCLSDLLGNPDHLAKVQFAFKLGYTEGELLTVIRQVGPDAKKDKILGELVRLTAKKIPSNETSTRSGVISDDGLRDIMEGLILDEEDDNLRHIIIDGSNLAMIHGNKEVFSCRGIQLAVDYFVQRGHKDITVFVPQWRKEEPRPETPIKNQDILIDLEKKKYLVFTPARRIGGKRVVCYDDRYIVKLAAETGGIVVSNDNYRDLVAENPEYRKVIEERLLMYSFVNDRFMPPDDPLGRHGPILDNFLRKEPLQTDQLPMICPYQKKCTYGNKCKYYHPERGLRPQKSVSEKLAEEARLKLQVVKERKSDDVKVTQTEMKKLPSEPTMITTREHVNISTDPERRRVQDERLDKYRLKIQEIEKQEQKQQQSIDNSSEVASGHRVSEVASGHRVSEVASGHRVSEVVSGHRVSYNPSYDNIQIPTCVLQLSPGFDDGSHLSLAKHLSMEESMKSQTDVISRGRDSLPIATIGSQVEELHRKLDRQLSLNNPDDYRISRQSFYKPYMSMSTTALDCTLHVNTTGPIVSELPRRHQQRVQARAVSERPRLLEHAQVGRMASDPYPRVKTQHDLPLKPSNRCNSTSDLGINATGSSTYLPSSSELLVMNESMEPSAGASSSWNDRRQHSPTNPQYPRYQFHPVSRLEPMRHQHIPQQPTDSIDSGLTYKYQQTRSHPGLHYININHQQRMSPYVLSTDSPISIDDPRYQLYYHLCCIFPEDRVRSVMNRHPNELNPQKICAYILDK
ncbi:uncharacterized protein LOC141908008 [Tubulanus polymorphus]|uniref:uncharacterized protein LOC141908008 n=1 Tax=Tubulanus polymorphus TaxID=672921 RepID=UPI003DA34D77